ncbi:MAG: hypothetical protein JO223_13030 [Hyphomicrobiales bacterium]|nr:hypothetical protein [Hyphomicrobiales bacterium]
MTPERIEKNGLARLGVYQVPGDARGLEAQPLILPRVRTATGPRDVMVLASMSDVLRAVDPRDGSLLWETKLGLPVQGSGDIDMWKINDHWGCLSTGVIDPDTQRLYQSCWVSPNGSVDPKIARWYMFVVNLADGSLAVPPVQIEGVSKGLDFDAMPRKQRSSLVETNVAGAKTVFGCSGTIFEVEKGAAGFCFAFDVASNRFTALLALSKGTGAGVWMGGQGVAADEAGDLYLVTGNGGFDGVDEFGESFVKLKYLPPTAGRQASLSVVGNWTPWTDAARIPSASGRRAGMAANMGATENHPSGAMITMAAAPGTPLKTAFDSRGRPLLLVFPQDPGRWSDEDWGSAGPACLFTIDICVAAGKDGIGYPVRASDPGSTTPADLADPKVNCGKLAAKPVWLTIDLGSIDPCPADPKDLNFLPQGDTAHLHMTPVQYFDPLLRLWTIFAWGENGILRKWSVSPSDGLKLVGEGEEPASEDVNGRSPGGMPGGFCSGSSNGADPDTAIIACTVPYGDGNQKVVEGRLLVYDAAHVTDGRLRVIWDSRSAGLPFVFNKFNPPVIDGGRIYVPDYSGGLGVYGLARQ